MLNRKFISYCVRNSTRAAWRILETFTVYSFSWAIRIPTRFQTAWFHITKHYFASGFCACSCMPICGCRWANRLSPQIALSGWHFPQPRGQCQGCVKKHWHYCDSMWVKICSGTQMPMKKKLISQIVKSESEITLFLLNIWACNFFYDGQEIKNNENRRSGKGSWAEHHSGKDHFEHQSRSVSWSLDGCWTVIGSEGYAVLGQGSSLDDLSAVANSTTEHHTEDHPNDLLREKPFSE